MGSFSDINSIPYSNFSVGLNRPNGSSLFQTLGKPNEPHGQVQMLALIPYLTTTSTCPKGLAKELAIQGIGYEVHCSY